MSNIGYELKFATKFKNMLKEGIKTSTIRKHTDLEKDDIFFVRSNGKSYYFKVTEVKRIRFDEINNNMAINEGYLHKDLLINELEHIYGANEVIRNSDLFYQIEFEKGLNDEIV